MDAQQIISEINRLPLAQQKKVLETVSANLKNVETYEGENDTKGTMHAVNEKEVRFGASEVLDKAEERRLRAIWIKANREEYGGQYIAMDGDKLVATGKNYPEAFEAAKRAGIENAFVDYLPKPDETGFMGGW